MKNPAVVFCWSSQTSPLPGVWPATHRALLPICGKPLIIHNLESLSAAGYRIFHIPRGPEQRAVRARLRDGTEWGVNIRYSDLTSDELMDVNLSRSNDCVLATADTLDVCSSADIFCQSDDHPQVRSSGLKHYKPGHWRYIEPGILERRSFLESPPLQTPTAFHMANLASVRGELAVTIPGGQIHNHNAHADWKCQISRSAYVGSNIFLGKQVLVGTNARLERDCVLSNGVVIGENVSLNNVTVLPNTFIPANANFENAVLCQNGYFSVQNSNSSHSEFVNSNQLSPSRENSPDSTGLPLNERAHQT